MANPTWPAGLPQYFLADGLQVKTEDDVLRAQPETGPAKTRRRTTQVRRQVTGRLRMTPAELAVFEAFWATDLAGGSLAFDWTMPTTQAAATFIATQPYAISSHGRGLLWDVQLTLSEIP